MDWRGCKVRITSRGEYGVRALFELALHYGQGPIALKLIAERQGISDHYLEQLMAAMRKSGLVKSIRGALGGYELAHAPEEVTIGAIVRALEGPIMAQPDGESGIVDDTSRQVIDAMWTQMAEQMNAVLDSYSLADLLENVERLRASKGTLMWHI